MRAIYGTSPNDVWMAYAYTSSFSPQASDVQFLFGNGGATLQWVPTPMSAVPEGIWGVANIRLDAIPDLSDVQVIVVADYAGQNPQVVEDQVTYPLTTAMLAVPGSTVVRGYSMFELSFVYVLFDEGTDARSIFRIFIRQGLGHTDNEFIHTFFLQIRFQEF